MLYATARFRAARLSEDREETYEEGRGNHQAVQTRRGQRGAVEYRGAGVDGQRGEGIRAPEGAYRALPRRGVRGGFSAQGEARDNSQRRARGAGGRNDRARGADRQNRRRQDLRHADGRGGANSHRRARRQRALAIYENLKSVLFSVAGDSPAEVPFA